MDERIQRALDDYNSCLRSACQIAKRHGESTNWDAFERRVSKVLKEHHATWLANTQIFGKRAA